ncbi:hypothetical protein [Paraburkholderia sp. DGU8]|uniref:hypothetical protein n=1 Tax=Paraburkholderia sp. DGU8 TaxID=3161997 RepID=UPI003465AEA4
MSGSKAASSNRPQSFARSSAREKYTKGVAHREANGGQSLTEADARAACERGLLNGLVDADDATRIEHCLNEHGAMPVGLAVLFN